MDKPFIKKILAVVLGISLIIMIFETASLISGAVFIGDLKLMQAKELTDLQAFMKWSAVGLACMLVPTLTSYAFAFFGKRKFFTLIAAILSFIIFVCCVAFVCVCRDYALQGLSEVTYASATGYLSELIQIAIAAVLIGVYYILVTVLPVKKAETVTDEEAENEEV